MSSYRIGVDVGGTFTDCVAIDDAGAVTLEKAPTTPDDQSLGVLDGLTRLAATLDLPDVAALLDRATSIVHGTTTGDNTMIQMSGAPTGLLVTEGFRDEIEMRRCYKEDIWDPALPGPEPIARRRLRLEIQERVTAEGVVETPLDEESVRRAARRLAKFGVRSIAIVFLHSYVEPTHELRARELVREEMPDVELISLSHEVYPKPPEFERTSTTLVNAYVGPPIVRYLERLETRLRQAGFRRELLIATSSGGVATPASVARRAVATIGSGPTGGVVAAAQAARRAGLDDIVSVDMGGTSYDVCLVRNGRPEIKSDWNWRHRYCIALPMVDIHAVGAGGGSLARDVGGSLQVGPESAGAQPGPACYGRGGTEATVTDADVILGRLDPSRFWSGRLALDPGAARTALARLGAVWGWDPEATAVAVTRIVDAHMTDAIRRVLSLAGADPRTLDLVAFGGMGAVHATTQAAALGMKRVLVPRAAPAFSALGLVSADHVVDATRTAIAPWQAMDVARLNELADELAAAAYEELEAAGVPRTRIRLDWMLNLVYPGQTFDTGIPLSRADTRGHDGAARITSADVAACVEAFHQRNEAARLIEARAQEPTVRGVRLVATGLVDRPAEFELAPAAKPYSAGARRLYADGWHDAAEYTIDDLGPGAEIVGPSVISGPFTTIVLRPDDHATVQRDGAVLIDVG